MAETTKRNIGKENFSKAFAKSNVANTGQIGTIPSVARAFARTPDCRNHVLRNYSAFRYAHSPSGNKDGAHRRAPLGHCYLLLKRIRRRFFEVA